VGSGWVPELVELIRTLAAEFSDAQIARILNRRRLRTAKGLAFNAYRVSNMRHVHGIEIATAGKRVQGEDVHTAQEAAAILGVDRCTVIRWVEAGLLRGAQFAKAAPWRIRITDQDQRRLTASDSPDGWLPLKGAARVLGVSQQTVLQKLKSGELNGVRVSLGRRSAWRIQILESERQQQPSLFDTATP
jgi:excisionase family DNA binding protein